LPRYDSFDNLIETVWGEVRGLPADHREPIVVAIYAFEDLALQHYVALRGLSQPVHTDLLLRKAEVVKITGMRYTEAEEYAKNDGVELLGDWIPQGHGTRYLGAAPVKVGKRIEFIVAVSGQDHRLFDQPFADAIAKAMEDWIQRKRQF